MNRAIIITHGGEEEEIFMVQRSYAMSGEDIKFGWCVFGHELASLGIRCGEAERCKVKLWSILNMLSVSPLAFFPRSSGETDRRLGDASHQATCEGVQGYLGIGRSSPRAKYIVGVLPMDRRYLCTTISTNFKRQPAE